MQLLIFRSLCAYKKSEAIGRSDFWVVPIDISEARSWHANCSARTTQSTWVQLGRLRHLLRSDLARSGIERPRVSHGFCRSAARLEIRRRNDCRDHCFRRSFGSLSFCRSLCCCCGRCSRSTRRRRNVSPKLSTAVDVGSLDSLPGGLSLKRNSRWIAGVSLRRMPRRLVAGCWRLNSFTSTCFRLAVGLDRFGHRPDRLRRQSLQVFCEAGKLRGEVQKIRSGALRRGLQEVRGRCCIVGAYVFAVAHIHFSLLES